VKATVVTGIVVSASLTVFVLWKVSAALRLRGLHSSGQGLSGLLAWIVSSGLLVAVALLLGREWRKRADPIRSASPALVALGLPVLAVVVVLSFQYPKGWPTWLDSDLAGAIAILAGGMLGVFLFPSSAVDGRSGQVGRWSLCVWSVLVVVAGTASVLFLE
jgi:hypothetical protein